MGKIMSYSIAFALMWLGVAAACFASLMIGSGIIFLLQPVAALLALAAYKLYDDFPLISTLLFGIGLGIVAAGAVLFPTLMLLGLDAELIVYCLLSIMGQGAISGYGFAASLFKSIGELMTNISQWFQKPASENDRERAYALQHPARSYDLPPSYEQAMRQLNKNRQEAENKSVSLDNQSTETTQYTPNLDYNKAIKLIEASEHQADKSQLAKFKQREENYLDPIHLDIMLDPVKFSGAAHEKQNFDRCSAEDILASANRQNPMNRAPITSTRLLKNRELKKEIKDFKKEVISYANKISKSANSVERSVKSQVPIASMSQHLLASQKKTGIIRDSKLALKPLLSKNAESSMYSEFFAEFGGDFDFSPRTACY